MLFTKRQQRPNGLSLHSVRRKRRQPSDEDGMYRSLFCRILFLGYSIMEKKGPKLKKPSEEQYPCNAAYRENCRRVVGLLEEKKEALKTCETSLAEYKAIGTLANYRRLAREEEERRIGRLLAPGKHKKDGQTRKAQQAKNAPLGGRRTRRRHRKRVSQLRRKRRTNRKSRRIVRN